MLNGVNIFVKTIDFDANITWMGDIPSAPGELEMGFLRQ